MPFSLPQISRREFLKRAALAGAAAALAPSSLAGGWGKPRDPHTLAFFSDVHIASDPAAEFLKVNMAGSLTACVHEVAAWPVRPAAVIVNGDLAFQSGQPGDYARFGKLIEPVRALAPVHLSMGNHDGRKAFWHAFPQDAAKLKSVPEKQAAVLEGERANWFLLDTLEITAFTPGLLGSAQIDWLTRELDARPGKPAVVVMHHNPQFPLPTSGLLDTEALLDVLTPRRQCKALIFGHTHDWNISLHESGIHLINLPPTGYVFKPGRPSGWVRTTLGTDGMEIELRALDVNHPEHAKVENLKWRG